MSHWPQIVFLALYALSIGRAGALHGKAEAGRHNLIATIVSSGISFWILYMGGFWESL